MSGPPPESTDPHEHMFRRLLTEHAPSEPRRRDVVPPAPGSELQKMGPAIGDGAITTHEFVTDSRGGLSHVAEHVERLGFRPPTDE